MSKGKDVVVVLDVRRLGEVELTYGHLMPVGIAYRLLGVARSYLYRLLEEQKLTKVVVMGGVFVPLGELHGIGKKQKKTVDASTGALVNVGQSVTNRE